MVKCLEIESVAFFTFDVFFRAQSRGFLQTYLRSFSYKCSNWLIRFRNNAVVEAGQIDVRSEQKICYNRERLDNSFGVSKDCLIGVMLSLIIHSLVEWDRGRQSGSW